MRWHNPVRYTCICESVVLPDQLVGSVVLVWDRGVSQGGGGYGVVTEEISTSGIAI